MKLCECGCGSPAAIPDRNWAKLGWIKGKSLRFAHGHNSRSTPEQRIAKFHSLVHKAGARECWLWLGASSTTGYGAFRCNGVRELAHRLAYTLACGEIPTGMFVLHSCDTPLCVNPGHLRVGTAAENSLDMVRRDRHMRGERAYGAKLTADIVREIRGSDESNLSVAERLGISDSQVSMIRARKRWRHVS